MNEFQLYSDIESKKTYFDIWGSSTKHPDCHFCLENLVKSEQFQLSDYCSIERNMFQFMLYCASRLNFDFNAYSVTIFAMKVQEEFYNNMLIERRS